MKLAVFVHRVVVVAVVVVAVVVHRVVMVGLLVDSFHSLLPKKKCCNFLLTPTYFRITKTKQNKTNKQTNKQS